MKKKSGKNPISSYESVKIKKDIVNKVRDSKEETKIPIGSFFEIAAEEKLYIIKKKKNA